MSWFQRRNVPQVKIEGNRFSIVPERESSEIIDVEAESVNLPAIRRSPSDTEQSVPRQGMVPAHSWGA